MFVTRKTLARLQNGEGGVTLSVLASAFWVLGMDKELLNMAIPEQDAAGIFMERQAMPQRIRTSKAGSELDF
jgi:hypothetical protein